MAKPKTDAKMSFGIGSRLLLSCHLLARSLATPVSVGALGLVVCEGKIVLVRHTYTPGWHFPGGGVHRGEPPEKAVVREVTEEIGLTTVSPPEFFGIYTRKVGLATNHIVLYRLAGARFDFKPNWEICDVVLADPDRLPAGTSLSIRRRLQECFQAAPRSLYW